MLLKIGLLYLIDHSFILLMIEPAVKFSLTKEMLYFCLFPLDKAEKMPEEFFLNWPQIGNSSIKEDSFSLKFRY